MSPNRASLRRLRLGLRTLLGSSPGGFFIPYRHAAGVSPAAYTALEPLFDAGRNQANLQLAQLGRDAAVAQYERAIQQAFREVVDALAGRATLGEQLRATLAQAEAEAARYRLAELRFKNGLSSSLELLDAQRSLFATEQAVVQTRLALLQNRVAVFRALARRLGFTEPCFDDDDLTLCRTAFDGLIDFDRLLEIQRPYLGPVKGYYTDWTPLDSVLGLFSPDLDKKDPWWLVSNPHGPFTAVSTCVEPLKERGLELLSSPLKNRANLTSPACGSLAAKGLARLGCDHAWPILQQALVDKKKETRIGAAVALGFMPRTEAVVKFAAACLAKERNGEVRQLLEKVV